MSELSIPVATMVGAELSHDSIKTLSDSYREIFPNGMFPALQI